MCMCGLGTLAGGSRPDIRSSPSGVNDDKNGRPDSLASTMPYNLLI